MTGTDVRVNCRHWKDLSVTLITGSWHIWVTGRMRLINNISRNNGHWIPPSNHGLCSAVILRGMWDRADTQLTPTILSRTICERCGIITTQLLGTAQGRKTAVSGFTTTIPAAAQTTAQWECPTNALILDINRIITLDYCQRFPLLS